MSTRPTSGCTCFVDGDDTATDCNSGLNGDGTMTPYSIGDLACGTASVYQDIGGDTYRDTDWWDDSGVLDAGACSPCRSAPVPPSGWPSSI